MLNQDRPCFSPVLKTLPWLPILLRVKVKSYEPQGSKPPGSTNTLWPHFQRLFHRPTGPVPCSPNMLGMVQSQDLCMCCFLCLEQFSPGHLHGSLPHFIQVSAPQRDFLWAPCLKFHSHFFYLTMADCLPSTDHFQNSVVDWLRNSTWNIVGA